MLEILSGQKSGIPRYTGSAPLAIITSQYLGRAYGTCTLQGSSLMVSGGFAAPANPYPSNFRVLTLSQDGLSTTTSIAVTGNDGTGAVSFLMNGTAWVGMGNDGGYFRYIRSRNPVTGALTLTTSNSPGTAQAYVKIAKYDSDRLFWGYGLSATGWTKDAYTYRISNNTWTALPSSPAEYGLVYGQFLSQNLADGRILVGFSSSLYTLIFFNPTTNQYSSSAPLTGIVDETYLTNSRLSPGTTASAVVGKYVLFFGQGFTQATSTILSCLRYDTETNKFSVIDFPTHAARWGARCVVDEDKQLLYLVGGLTQSGEVAPAGSVEKFSQALVYPFSQFLI